MTRSFPSLIVLVLGFIVFSPAKADESRALLFDAIGQRLGLMKSVAHAKFAQNLPIEDREREAVVITAAVSSSAARGLTTASAQLFFEAQIEAAKAIQTYWFKRWKDEPPSYLPPNLVTYLRPKLLVLGNQITERLDTPVTDQHRAEFMDATDIEGLDPDQRIDLFLVLRDLKTRSLLDRIQRSGIVKIGTTLDYPPFSAGSLASPEGIDIELALRLALKLGVKVEWVKTTWPELMTDFSVGRFDIGMSGISITPRRAQIAAFSRPYHIGGKTPIGRCKDQSRYPNFKAIDQPTTLAIVNPGGTNEKFALERLKQAQVRTFDDNRLIFEEIIAGRADVMFTDEIEVVLQTGKTPSLCALLPGQRLTHQEKGLLMPKDPSLVTFVNRWLTRQIAAGRIEALKKQYLGAEASPP